MIHENPFWTDWAPVFLFVIPMFMFTCWLVFRFIHLMFWKARERKKIRLAHQRAREKILADGKIEGPKGTFKWRRWASKWVDYANSLPAPNALKRMPSTRDFPRKPHVGEDE